MPRVQKRDNMEEPLAYGATQTYVLYPLEDESGQESVRHVLIALPQNPDSMIYEMPGIQTAIRQVAE